MAAKRTACYFCTGCDLGERLDIDALKVSSKRVDPSILVREHEALCSADGLNLIRGDIASGAVSHACIAACSPRFKQDTFALDEALIVSRANLREGVVWGRPMEDDANGLTQSMATDQLAMAMATLYQTAPGTNAPKTPSVPTPSGVENPILVVGGGMTGMSAALAVANAGRRAVIVEKSANLGGAMARMRGRTPQRAPYSGIEDTGVAELTSAVEAHELITVLLDSAVVALSGAPGHFVARIASADQHSESPYDAVIQATGWRPFDAHRLSRYGYRDNADVITQMELEELVRAADFGPIKRPSDGRVVDSVLFVQCAGQRSDLTGELDSCSGHCCMTSIKQAMYFKDTNPDIDTTVLYSDLRTPGSRGEDFLRAGLKKGVTFVHGRFSSITTAPSGPVAAFTDSILDETRTIAYDLVVLATAMLPTALPPPVEATTAVAARKHPDFTENDSETALDANSGDATRHPPLSDALPYIGDEPPRGGFAHATARPGIVTAGSAVRAMDLAQAMEDGVGAALKALQPPVTADTGFAYQPMGIHEQATDVDRVIAQLRRCILPQGDDAPPHVLVLAGPHTVLSALDLAARDGLSHSARARVLPLPITPTDTSRLVHEAFKHGFGGVSVIHDLPRGDTVAAMREALADIPALLDLEPERISLHCVTLADFRRIPELIDTLVSTVETLGPQPRRGSATT
ncbi:MAG: FAD-dependent oxidoreductase [Gammaproteobacteria bacterium]